MNLHKTPLFGHTFPLEIFEMIVSYLPLPTVAELMKSKDTNLALAARRRYYSNIQLNFKKLPHEDGYSSVTDEVLVMKISEFEALVNSDTFDQLIIKELSIVVEMDIVDFTFLHGKVFTKASSIVIDVKLWLDLEQGEPEELHWNWLPSSPLVQECIREISINYAYIDPDVPALPSNLRMLSFLYNYDNWNENDYGIIPRIVFPPNLQTVDSRIPWVSMPTYTGLPSTLKILMLENVLDFSVKAFNKLNFPDLKYLRLKNISNVTEINDHFKLPLLLKILELESLNITNFEQQTLPLGLQGLSISNCPLRKFRVDTFPDSLKELNLVETDIPSSEIGIIKFPPSFVSLLVTHTRLASLDFVNSLPGSLEILNLRSNSFVRLNGEAADSTRSHQIKFPENLQNLYLEDTEHLFTLYSPGDLVFPPSLRDLNLGSKKMDSVEGLKPLPPALNSLNLRYNNLVSVEGLRLPPALNHLDLSFNRLVSINELDLPPALTSLNLGFNKLNLVKGLNLLSALTSLNLRSNGLDSVKGLNLPPGLTSLDLSSNTLISVEGLDIPPRLTHLYLSGNSLQQFSKTLPESIETISLGYNKLKELVNFHLPVNCTELNLSGNPLQKLQISNAHDPDLKLQDLTLNEVAITTLSDISPLPQSLTSLGIVFVEVSSLSGILFPTGLTWLGVFETKLTSLKNVKFPPYLEELHLLRNQISSLANVHFPNSLTKLELFDNKITTIDAVRLPPKLKILNLAGNEISAINELQLPELLEKLSLADQKCDTPHNPVSTRKSFKLGKFNFLKASSKSSKAPGKKGLSSLTGLTKLPSKLEYLGLNGNNLSEKAVQHLEFPASLSQLLIYDNAFDNYDRWERKIKLTHPGMLFKL
ncbi:hypothetical protein BABINDRAFT_160340 [Babjeviella inositovora NRRL Y-12698]|uniref:Uncharacterized protein n=1 Tax=Babjeviella inositovora NRRL Y-12698 TaxID=984486 RepID=A0A1E3QV06_9ASCO|nr:uncharacterized protein BABINDRAFT_160340 [Babjeviella inositovora NRRL Y-12698]ODQ80892.1 hypothetical protein BABINDRAFT_160340 [Babjeviella inositovora NRRL Y-12698]